MTPDFQLYLNGISAYEGHNYSDLDVQWFEPDEDVEDGRFYFSLYVRPRDPDLSADDEPECGKYSFELPREQAEALRDYLTFMLERVP